MSHKGGGYQWGFWILDNLWYLGFGAAALIIGALNIQSEPNYETILLMYFGVMSVGQVLGSVVHRMIWYYCIMDTYDKYRNFTDGRYATEEWPRRISLLTASLFLLVNSSVYAFNSSTNSTTVNNAAAVCSIAGTAFETVRFIMAFIGWGFFMHYKGSPPTSGCDGWFFGCVAGGAYEKVKTHGEVVSQVTVNEI